LPLFDTTFIVDLTRAEPEALRRAERTDEENVPAALSVLSVHEYLSGVHRKYGKQSREMLQEKLATAHVQISRFEVIPLTGEIAEISSGLQAELMRLGKPIGINDLYIAATALKLDLTLVTRNLAEFKQVPKLKLESY
jgi:tRNA(fMet)-specific endonuclease VapC